jgi:uncharacterized protein (TIGR02453 family)
MIYMTKPAMTNHSFELLGDLVRHNAREWYEANRDALREHVQEPFGAILQAAGERTKDLKVALSGGPQTMLRLNRDLRFSKDRRPYREQVSGLLTPSGTKEVGDGVVFVMMTPEAGRTSAGFYKTPTADLTRIRDRIIADPARFSEVIGGLRDHGLSLCDDDKLTTMPRGLGDHASLPHAESIRLKSFLVRLDLPKSCWIDGEVVDRIARHARHCAPLLAFCAP